jgi:nicotinamide mononucleotide transporter
LQGIYLVISLYGLLLWVRVIRKKSDKGNLAVSRIHKNTLLLLMLLMLVAALMVGYLLSATDNQVPYMDGLISAMGLAATWMTARKYLANWLLWIVNDLICVGLYAYMGLWLTMGLYVIFAIMAVVGYFSWKKSMISVKQ